MEEPTEVPSTSSCDLTSTGDGAVLAAFSFAVNVVMSGTICVGGVICNVLSILTLQMDRHRPPTSVLLQGLALTDLVFLAYAFIYTCLRSVYPYTGHLHGVYAASAYIIAYLLPVGWIAQTAAIWLVTLVTVDRYVAVCHPFCTCFTLRRSRLAVLTVWIAAILFNLPRFFYYHQQAFHAPTSNATFVAHLPWADPFWVRYRTIYHVYLTMALLFIIPLPVLVVLNVKLFREISDARQRQLQLSGTRAERDSLSVTVNLIAVVTVFIACETPDFVASVITLDPFCINRQSLEYFMCIKELLLIMNASGNFFIYCYFYRNFRKLLRTLLCHPFLKLEEWTTSSVPEKINRSSASPLLSQQHQRHLLQEMNGSRTSVV